MNEMLREYRARPRLNRVTINDVAREIGLTKGTVSRALNDYPDIAEETRLRVARAAERMGYRPHSHAQAIRTGRAQSLGLVLTVDRKNPYKPFLTNFVDGISRVASAENWTLTLMTAQSDGDELSILERLARERKVDGFILPRTRLDDRRIALLQAIGCPFVLHGRAAAQSGCAWYDVRSDEAMKKAVLRLAKLGHRRIGFINGGAAFTYAALRLAGYRDGLSAAGLVFDPALVRQDAMVAGAGERAARVLLALDEPPTAIVTALDQTAIGVCRVAADKGLSFGAALSVIAYGDLFGRGPRPALTGFAVDMRRAGERLAEMLLARIRGAPAESLRQTVAARFVAGDSDGPPALTSKALARRLAQ